MKRATRTRRSHAISTKLQQTLTGQISYLDNNSHYGDNPKSKEKACIRTVFGNIDGLRADLQNEKDPVIWKKLEDLLADTAGLVEINLNWRNIPPEANLYARLHYQQTRPVKGAVTHNRHSRTTSRTQYGGCASLIYQRLLPRVIATECDPEGLGRWISHLIEGKREQRARFVTGYFPCKNGGKGTVYTQQRSYFQALPVNNKRWNKNPHDAWLEDFQQEVQTWSDNNEKIVIQLDANGDVRHGKVATMLRSLGFEEQITYRHGAQQPPPGTHIANTRGTPIDGIWTNFDHGEMRCGYCSFDEGLPGDHRTAWIDIPLKALLGYNPPDLHRVFPPDLTTQDPRLRKRYNERVRAQMAPHEIEAKVRKLRAMVQADVCSPDDPPFSHEEINELHKEINNTRRDISWKVAKELRKKHTGAYPFSPKVQSVMMAIILWSKLIYYRSHHKRGTRQIRRLMHRLNIEDAFTLSVADMKLKRKALRRSLRSAREDSIQWRRNWQLELAKARAAARKSTVAGEIKQHIQTEKQRRAWRRVGIVNKKGHKAKVTKIWVTHKVPGPHGTEVTHREECVTKPAMEKAVMEENETRFTRCLSSAFFGTILLALFGVMFDGPGFWQVLQGTWQPPPPQQDLDPYALELLQEATDNMIDPCYCTRPSHITQEEHSYYWQRRRAGTASESSELSFAHYIVGSYCKELAEVDASLRSAAYELGFVPDVFATFTDFQILKALGVYDVAKMRTIKLMVALFNENNKKLGRDMMAHAEQASMIAPEQGGSRKGRSSGLLGAEVGISFDISRQQRLPMAHVGLDASQCYDRIVHTPAAVCMVQHGAHEPAVRSMFGTLQEGSNKVATAFGTSTATYGGAKRRQKGLHPVQGSGQGNGAGPASFVAISSNGISIMRKKGYGATMIACLSLLTLVMACFMFVDDDQYQQTAEDVYDSGEDVLAKSQAGLDQWVGFLQATGGAINPEKSYWYLLDYEWTPSGWSYRSQDSMPGELVAPNPGGEIKALKRSEPHQAEKQLGMFTAPDGNMTDQLEHLKTKADQFADRMSSQGMLTRNEAWMSYNHTISKTMEYPMASTTLTQDEWKSVATVINMAALPKSGFVKTFTHHILYGPQKYQGMGKMEFWHNQELTHLFNFVNEINKQSTCGQRYQITMEQLRLEQGYGGPFTDVPFSHMGPLTTDSWIKTLWQSCQDFDISIHDSFGTLTELREGDVLLMPLFVKRYGHDKPLLKCLQECRQFVQAVSLADLCTMKGERIWDPVFQGTAKCQTARGIRWPRQPPQLSEKHWNTWRWALNDCFVQFASRTHDLNKPLGRWLVDPVESCKWLFCHESGRLFQRTSSQVTEWQTDRVSRAGIGNQLYTPTGECTSVPLSVSAATVTTVSTDSVTLDSYT